MTRTAVWALPAVTLVAAAPAFASSECVVDATVTISLLVDDAPVASDTVVSRTDYVDAVVVVTNNSNTDDIPLGAELRLSSAVSGGIGTSPFQVDDSMRNQNDPYSWSIATSTGTLQAPIGPGQAVSVTVLGGFDTTGVRGEHQVTVIAHFDLSGVAPECGVLAPASVTVPFEDDGATVG